ncbi:hypothetical protein IscW_ISCW011933, partial [Ixodes scapularis]
DPFAVGPEDEVSELFICATGASMGIFLVTSTAHADEVDALAAGSGLVGDFCYAVSSMTKDLLYEASSTVSSWHLGRPGVSLTPRGVPPW